MSEETRTKVDLERVEMSSRLTSAMIEAVRDAVVKHGPDPFISELIVTSFVVAIEELRAIVPSIRMDVVQGLGVQLVG